MTTEKKEILVLAPHTDDGELGLGGTIARLIAEGKTVDYVAFSTAEESVPEGMPKNILETEVKAATACLGIEESHIEILHYGVRKFPSMRQEILEDMISIRKRKQYDMVFCPSLHDVHQDHITIAQEAVRSFKGTTILGYELIWNNLTFDATCFVGLEKSHIEAKCRALAAYRSQEHRSYTAEDFIYSMARARGVQAGAEYAEAFEVIRWFI